MFSLIRWHCNAEVFVILRFVIKIYPCVSYKIITLVQCSSHWFTYRMTNFSVVRVEWCFVQYSPFNCIIKIVIFQLPDVLDKFCCITLGCSVKGRFVVCHSCSERSGSQTYVCFCLPVITSHGRLVNNALARHSPSRRNGAFLGQLPFLLFSVSSSLLSTPLLYPSISVRTLGIELYEILMVFLLKIL